MKWKTIIFWAVGAVVFAAVIGVCVFLAFTLRLRTEYKETALRINESILACQERGTIRFNGKEAAADSQLLNFIDAFLQNSNTVVYSRKDAETDAEPIAIDIGNSELTLAGLEDGSAILIHWTTPDEEKIFRVRSSNSYMTLQSYCRNYMRKNS